MSIIAVGYTGIQATDYGPSSAGTEYKTPYVLPARNGNSNGYSRHGAFWWYKDCTNGRMPTLGGTRWNLSNIGEIDYSDNPNKKEFWLRWRWDDPWNIVGSYWSLDAVYADFLSIVDGVQTLTHRIYVDSSALLRLAVYDPTKAAGTVLYDQSLGNCWNAIKRASDGTVTLDIRVSLDQEVGFIQAYKSDGTRALEFIGKTTSTLKPTHININNFLQGYYHDNAAPYYSICLYAIAADEPTFGMVVAGLFPKAEGGLQDQIAGTNGSALYGRLQFPEFINPVNLKPDAAGVTKQYTLIPENLTDMGMPDNYTVKALKLHSVYDALSTDNVQLPTATLLRFKSDATLYSYPTPRPIQPNIPAVTTNAYQHAGVLLNKNPKTGLPWTAADIADIEYGFSVTGV